MEETDSYISNDSTKVFFCLNLSESRQEFELENEEMHSNRAEKSFSLRNLMSSSLSTIEEFLDTVVTNVKRNSLGRESSGASSKLSILSTAKTNDLSKSSKLLIDDLAETTKENSLSVVMGSVNKNIGFYIIYSIFFYK